MNQSENVAFAMPYEQITHYAKIQGQGVAAPIRAPTTFSATSTKGFMFASHNFVSPIAADITRSGVGVYAAKLRDGLPLVLAIVPTVMGTDGKRVQVQDYNPTTRVISFSAFDAAGLADDLDATDFVTFTLIGTKSVPGY